MAELIACLVQLRTEFNSIAPGRAKASDGWIGDTAHQAEVSDHNDDETGSVPIHDADSKHEVHAVDVDNAGPWPFSGGMEAVVQHLLARCRAGAETRLRYVIYNRRIWSASSSWAQKAYTGASPHTEHAHFSASYDTAREASTASWHLEDLVALTDADLDKIEALFKRTTQADGSTTSRVGRDAWDQGIPNPIAGGKDNAWEVLRDIGAAVKIMESKLDAVAAGLAAAATDPDTVRIELVNGAEPLRVALDTTSGPAPVA